MGGDRGLCGGLLFVGDDGVVEGEEEEEGKGIVVNALGRGCWIH